MWDSEFRRVEKGSKRGNTDEDLTHLLSTNPSYITRRQIEKDIRSRVRGLCYHLFERTKVFRELHVRGTSVSWKS